MKFYFFAHPFKVVLLMILSSFIFVSCEESTELGNNGEEVTAAEIDSLEQLLEDSIKNAGDSVNVSGPEYREFQKLKDSLIATKRKATDSLLNLYITKQLTKIFDDSAGYWNKSYVRSANQVKNELSEFAEAGIITTEDDLINSFKIKLKNQIQKADDSFKWSDYPEFESWAMKKFNQEGGTLDNIIKDFQPYVKKSTDRDAAYGNKIGS
jgi:hypothetical protein